MSYSVSRNQRPIAVVSTSQYVDWTTCWMPKEFWVNSKQREEIYFFCKVSRTALEPTHPALQVLLGDVSPWLKVKNLYIFPHSMHSDNSTLYETQLCWCVTLPFCVRRGRDRCQLLFSVTRQVTDNNFFSWTQLNRCLPNLVLEDKLVKFLKCVF